MRQKIFLIPNVRPRGNLKPMLPEHIEQAIVDFQSGEDPESRNSELIFKHFRPMVRNLIRRSGNFSFDECEDLIQEVFTRVFRGMRALQSVGAFSGWLRRITHNVVVDYAAGRPDMVSLDDRGEDEDGTALRGDLADTSRQSDPFEATLARERAERLAEAEKTLTARQYDCWYLRYHMERSLAEIAKIMGVEVGTVKATLSQAKKKIKDFLNPEDQGADGNSQDGDTVS